MRVQFSASVMVSMTALAMAFGLGACTVSTNNVAIKGIDNLRAAQSSCLASNARQMDDRTSDPERIARLVATACNDATEKLVSHAIVNPQPQERQAFEQEAERRAAGYVKLSRSGSI